MIPHEYKPTDPTCVLSLDMQDIRNGVVYDHSAALNHADIVGAISKSGNYGMPCLSFDGVDDNLNCGNDSSLNMGIGDFTLGALINTSTFGAVQAIVTKCHYISGNTGFIIRIETNGKMTIVMNDGVYDLFSSVTTALKINTMYLIMVSFDRSGYATVYANGVIIGKVDISARSGDIDNIYPLRVGSYRGVGDWFNGCIYNIGVWGRVLSQHEVGDETRRLERLYGIKLTV